MRTFKVAIFSSLLTAIPVHADPLRPDEKQDYEALIAQEREARSRERFVENAAGGVAAMIIGIYGYYNDDRGTLVKLAYGAAQTSGVIMLCKSIFDFNNPSLLTRLDERMASEAHLGRDELKREILRVEHLRDRSQAMTLAVSSSILGTLYLYNAYRTQPDDTELRNIFYFLSFNFYVAAAGSWFKILGPDTDPRHAGSGLSLTVLPTPQITYVFSN